MEALRAGITNDEAFGPQKGFICPCFENWETQAVVYDEGKTHRGRLEIQDWISQRNEQYKTSMKLIAYTKEGNIGLLSAAISGNFDGNPIVLTYHFELLDGLIRSLKITG